MRTDATGDSRDLLSDRLATFAMYGLPIIALVVTGFLNVGNAWQTAVWAVALVTMGAGCVVNALRCGRVHCYVTGPFFLLMALVTVLFGLNVAPFGALNWNGIALATLIGGVALYYLPEVVFGRYRQQHK